MYRKPTDNNPKSHIGKIQSSLWGEPVGDSALWFLCTDSSEDSDIDIAAIVRGSRIELQEKLKELWNTAAQLSLDYDIVISPTVIPYGEFEVYKSSLPYYRNIAKEGIRIG